MKKVNIINITIINCFVLFFTGFSFFGDVNVLAQENEPWYQVGNKVYNNSENIGIGTSEPSQRLHVHDGALKVSGGDNIGDALFFLWDRTGYKYLFKNDLDNLQIHSFEESGRWNGEIMTIYPNGGLRTRSDINVGGPVFNLGTSDGWNSGSKRQNRALVHQDWLRGWGIDKGRHDVLTINFDRDFESGVLIQGPVVRIDGELRANSIKVKQDIFADYVFEEDYKLNDIYYVKSHIKEKGHLPDVPSADQVIGNDLDLEEYNALLLRKIEELTLYTIQQQEEIDELKKQ
jgi:hypothetical protein